MYSPQILPPGLYDSRNGLFPIESCLYAIEVKSTLNAAELVKAIESAKRIRELTPGNTFHFTRKKMKKAGTPPPICALFAFDSDLDVKGKTELERYIENDDPTDPAIAVLCVVGRGYCCTCDGGWRYYQASEFDEVLSFFAGITNTLPAFLAKKGRPQFGGYLIKDTGGEIIKTAE